MRRFVPVVVLGAIALIAGAVLLVYAVSQNDGQQAWRTVRDQPSGITLRLPSDWSIQRFGRYCRRVGPGRLVSNLRGYTFENARIPNGCTNRWQLEGLPVDFVLVDASVFSSPWLGARDDTGMPLELRDFQRPAGQDYAYAQVVQRGTEYSVRVWQGSDASAEDDDELAHVIRSITISAP